MQLTKRTDPDEKGYWFEVHLNTQAPLKEWMQAAADLRAAFPEVKHVSFHLAPEALTILRRKGDKPTVRKIPIINAHVQVWGNTATVVSNGRIWMVLEGKS